MGYDFLSAVNLARFFIDSDDQPRVDFLEDSWYGTPSQFTEMDSSKRFHLEISDAESKIDLNKAQEPFLIQFFETLKKHGIPLKTEPKKLAASILAWRGQTGSQGGPTLGFKHKRAPFETVEELRLIQHITPEDVELLKPFVTAVYGLTLSPQVRVNLNTVHPYILEALISSLTGGDFTKRDLYEKIMKLRDEKQVFWQEDLAMEPFLRKLGLSNSPTEIFLLTQFLSFVTVDSQFFLVHVKSRLPRKESFTLDVVLGPRTFRQVLVSPRGTELAKSPGQIVAVPLEILFWQEGLS
ncbi:MAG: general secretion pathway protein GspK [Candidatus Omnitrophica bacterium]|nr:general secretion pathway protein GspK [Candidatus Omnitrophota bacterium]